MHAPRSIPRSCDSQDGIEITFFVPCLNEQGRIGGTLETIRDVMGVVGASYEVLVVDDGCTDQTVPEVEQFRFDNPSMDIRIVRNPRNLGLSRSFVDSAFIGRGRYYRLVCGDNVEPLESMVSIVSARGCADMIIPYFENLPGKSPLRRCVSKCWTSLVNLVGGHHLPYYNGCGLYLRYHVMRWAPYNYGFGFQADLITLLLDEGASYKTICVEGLHLEKGLSKSPLNLKNLLSTGHTLFRIMMRRLREFLFVRR
jgi:glycosyltransferase involved in cell wall biosynthesis